VARLILHHYDTSPFSEKVRLLLGVKGLPWSSVIQPVIMPKPELIPLTGGYRRIPVLQIGADVYCDSQVIMAEIAARAGGIDAAGWVMNLWADRLFFAVTVPVIFAEVQVPPEFIADREKLSGRPFDAAQMKAAAPYMAAQWRAEAAWLDEALTAAPFLAGEAPGLADIAAYMNVWFLYGAARATAERLMAGLYRLEAWRLRMRALGHGTRSELSPADALADAKAAEPAAYTDHDPHDPQGLAPGARVSVNADDYGRDPIAGTLVATNTRRVVIAREDPALGRLNIHFPRVGYVLTPV
jgi:glutathione S-transferase